jgi:hypothetical protein
MVCTTNLAKRSALMSQEKYIGMDVHQATLSVAVMDAEGRLIWKNRVSQFHRREARMNLLGGRGATISPEEYYPVNATESGEYFSRVPGDCPLEVRTQIAFMDYIF